MLAHLRARPGEQIETRLLPWRNFVHPGDPLGSPLDPLIPHLINSTSTYIELKDVITTAPLDWLFTPVKNRFPALIDTFRTHTGYWQSQVVAETIGQIIFEATDPVQAMSKALQPGEQ